MQHGDQLLQLPDGSLYGVGVGVLQGGVGDQRPPAIIVEGGQGVLPVAAQQQQKCLGSPAAQLLHVQDVIGLRHQRRAMADHLVRRRQIQPAVTGQQILDLRGGGVAGADGGKHGLVLPYPAHVAAGIGGHGDAVGPDAALHIHRRGGGAGVHYGVKPLGLGHVHQVGQHVHAHEAVAQIALRLQHHGRQQRGRLADELAAMIAQGLRLGHVAGAVHIGEILRDPGGQLVRLRPQYQGQGRFPGTDLLL